MSVFEKGEKLKKVASSLIVALLFLGFFAFISTIQPVRAVTGTITINPDGSISSPVTANITTSDKVTYTFTGNNYLPVIVRRNNTIIDGAGYTLQGTGATYVAGMNLTRVSNITVKNMRITNFYDGVFLDSSSVNAISDNNMTANNYGVFLYISSDSNTVSGNNITASDDLGVYLASSSGNIFCDNNLANNSLAVFLYSSSVNTVSDNNIVSNGYGVQLDSSSVNTISGNNMANTHANIEIYFSSDSNTVSGNNITASDYGVHLYSSSENTFSGNNIASNYYGVELYSSSFDNTFYHNNFVNNAQHVRNIGSPNTHLDDGYPSGGNYWSDYTTRYPSAVEIDDSCIWNTPYVIDANNQDNYPLIGPWTIKGENIAVTPASDVTITFADVTSEGITTVNETLSGPPPPAGCKIEGPYTDIQTTAGYSGNIRIALSYYDTSMVPWEEETLRLMRWNATSQEWEDITTQVDTVNNVIYGVTNHLSMFGITAGPIPGDINLDGVVDISDAALIGAWWQQRVPPAPAEVDINSDGIVDISDAALVGGNWQQHV